LYLGPDFDCGNHLELLLGQTHRHFVSESSTRSSNENLLHSVVLSADPHGEPASTLRVTLLTHNRQSLGPVELPNPQTAVIFAVPDEASGRPGTGRGDAGGTASDN
jgi:hypothetical protein